MFLTIPAMLYIGMGGSVVVSITASICLGFGWGWFDVNNMPILCQFIPSHQRATAYGLMNMCGVLFGAIATSTFGKIKADQMYMAFVFCAFIVLMVTSSQLLFLKPKTLDFK